MYWVLWLRLHYSIWFLAQPVQCEDLIRAPAGLDSELPAEIPGTFVQLPLVRPSQSDVSSTGRENCKQLLPSKLGVGIYGFFTDSQNILKVLLVELATVNITNTTSQEDRW